jgi:hypothetical protein
MISLCHSPSAEGLSFSRNDAFLPVPPHCSHTRWVGRILSATKPKPSQAGHRSLGGIESRSFCISSMALCGGSSEESVLCGMDDKARHYGLSPCVMRLLIFSLVFGPK